MKENLNIEYNGFKANGFAILFSVLALIGLSIWGIVISVNAYSVILGITCGVVILAALISLCGLMVIEPNQARVMVFFGKYRGNFLKEGFWWVNPFMSVKKISLRARNLNADPIKVNDKMGNPIMIGLVLVWKVKADEIYKAVFNIDVIRKNYHNIVYTHIF
jgi:regulator of protease activity HflC (stomatin/prohibitin superfamily)